ncbi:DUF1109 domain-containing protein [Qipengyuania sphaerica]|uniref:DUF1109 domain-containing protein n=1 Tax=Qipengyuania sphaerica TaxID=2867243 RepID=UPI001C8A79C7|nr:DUF1109 domain-containing protein [Qipengyuania sphaerica]MBX7542075.1 DUF1109 domain-containing protein [Qipengyuania sphaerica]
MNRVSNHFFDQLAGDLAPVRPIRRSRGIALVAVAAIVTIVLVALFGELQTHMIAGQATPMFFVTNGMLALLGAASSLAVVRMATPQVGSGHEGARWSAGMVALLPVTALIMLGATHFLAAIMEDSHGVPCLLASITAGLVTAIALVFWLRRGAPVSLTSAGTYAGVAAGAIGSFAYGLTCPIETIGHLGIWHVAPVLVGGIAGRLAIPPLVRW